MFTSGKKKLSNASGVQSFNLVGRTACTDLLGFQIVTATVFMLVAFNVEGLGLG